MDGFCDAHQAFRVRIRERQDGTEFPLGLCRIVDGDVDVRKSPIPRGITEVVAAKRVLHRWKFPAKFRFKELKPNPLADQRGSRQPTDTFPTVYASRDPATAIREVESALENPRLLFEGRMLIPIQVTLHKILDLTQAGIRRKLRIRVDSLLLRDGVSPLFSTIRDRPTPLQPRSMPEARALKRDSRRPGRSDQRRSNTRWFKFPSVAHAPNDLQGNTHDHNDHQQDQR